MLKHVFSRIFQQLAVILTPATRISVPRPTLQRAIIEKSLPVPRKKRKVDIVKGIRNLFSLEKKSIKDEILEDVRTFSEKHEDYCKSIKTKGAFNGNYIEFESNGARYENVLLAEYQQNSSVF